MWNDNNEFASTFSSPNANAKETKKLVPKHVVPVTGQQILECTNVENESTIFECGSVKFSQVCFMGIIRNVIKRANDTTYLINDMTSSDINVKQQADEEDNEEGGGGEPRKEQQQYIENQYVRVNGIVKSLQNEKIVQAFGIRPVANLNELTNHMLEVINTSIHYATGGSQGADNNGANSLGGAKSGGGNGDSNGGLTGIQHEVSAFIKQSKSSEGAHVNELFEQFTKYPQNKIKEALEFLSNEGHIYTSIDDEHFKSTDSDTY
jgi:replication factor A2